MSAKSTTDVHKIPREEAENFSFNIAYDDSFSRHDYRNF